MFLRELVEKNRVCFNDSFDTWEEAVAASCVPLLNDGSIEHDYVNAVIECVKKYGPYIVLAPNIAMPHSQEGAVGVNESAICFMKLNKPVEFTPGDPDKNAKLFFVLASKDHSIHIENMQKLAMVLLNEELVEALMNANSAEDLIAIDEKYSEI